MNVEPLARAVEAVRAGLIVGVPTDTVYGVGVDPTNLDAVRALFDLKGRPSHKPVGLLAASLEQAAGVAVLDDRAAELARRHWPGALTLVVRPRVVLSDWVGDEQQRTVGIRVPDHPMAMALLEETGPLSVTSANLSGEPEVMNDVEARAMFGDRVAVYIPGTSPGGEASTVVDVSEGKTIVIREGPILVD